MFVWAYSVLPDANEDGEEVNAVGAGPQNAERPRLGSAA